MATTSSNLNVSSDSSLDSSSSNQLTQEQVDRSQKNRKRALEIKAAKENVAKM